MNRVDTDPIIDLHSIAFKPYLKMIIYLSDSDYMHMHKYT